MLLTRSNLSSKVFGIVCIAFLVSSGISLGFGIISFGLIITVLLCLFLKNIENFFLFWLLLSPLLTIDALAFYIIYGHPILTFDRVVIGTLFLLLLIEVSIGKRKLLPMNNLEIAMILFSVVIIYSIISYSANKLTGARMFVDSFLYPFIIYFLTKNLISDVKYFNKFINVLIIIGTYLSLMGIYEYLTGIDIFPTATGLVKREGWLRVNGPYKLDSTFGVNVTICFFITLYKYIGYNKNNGMNMRKVSFILILSFLLLAIFFNFYRGIWIAFILGSLFWIFMKMKSIKLMFYILILAMIVILSYDRLESTDLFQGRISNVKSLHSRLHAFDNAINLIKTNCIIGVGFGNYSYVGRQHNTFLAFLSETGILGFGLFMILFLFIFYKALKNYNLSRDYLSREFSIIFLCILITFMITCIGQNTGFEPRVNMLFFAIVGLLYSPSLIQEKFKLESGPANIKEIEILNESRVKSLR